MIDASRNFETTTPKKHFGNVPEVFISEPPGGSEALDLLTHNRDKHHISEVQTGSKDNISLDFDDT